MLSDDALLDFDAKRLAQFSTKDARAWLDDPTRREVYRAQLVAAQWVDGWRQRMNERTSLLAHHSDDWHEGFDEALRDVVAHLRQGDLMPGGVLHDEEDGELGRR